MSSTCGGSIPEKGEPIYVYIKSDDGKEQDWFAVGFSTPAGTWIEESLWADRDDAAERVNYLNGGTGAPMAGKGI